MIFRQMFDSTSGTYSYLLASCRGLARLRLLIPVLEKVDRYLQVGWRFPGTGNPAETHAVRRCL